MAMAYPMRLKLQTAPTRMSKTMRYWIAAIYLSNNSTAMSCSVRVTAPVRTTGKNNSMMIVGLGVTTGRVEPRAKVRVIRADAKVGSGEVANLKK